MSRETKTRLDGRGRGAGRNILDPHEWEQIAHLAVAPGKTFPAVSASSLRIYSLAESAMDLEGQHDELSFE
jgi:hypothetical protein